MYVCKNIFEGYILVGKLIKHLNSFSLWNLWKLLCVEYLRYILFKYLMEKCLIHDIHLHRLCSVLILYLCLQASLDYSVGQYTQCYKIWFTNLHPIQRGKNALENTLQSSDLLHRLCVGVDKQCTYKDIYYLPAKCVLQQRNPNSKMKTINQPGMQCLETKELQLHLHSLAANAAAALYCYSKLNNLSPLHSTRKYRICVVLAHT